jgi:hypothetical protein
MGVQINLPDWQTIEQLRLATKDGILEAVEFKVLICPTLFINEEEDEEIDGLPSVSKLKKKLKEAQDKPDAIGFKLDDVESDEDEAK